jgi:hypothetical protein
MRVLQSKNSTLLQELADSLQRIGRTEIATQLEIERVTGVDQATISRARSNKLRRVTQKILKLKRYADMCVTKAGISDDLVRAAEVFYASGGSKAELLASIHQATSLVANRLPVDLAMRQRGTGRRRRRK